MTRPNLLSPSQSDRQTGRPDARRRTEGGGAVCIICRYGTGQERERERERERRSELANFPPLLMIRWGERRRRRRGMGNLDRQTQRRKKEEEEKEFLTVGGFAQNE